MSGSRKGCGTALAVGLLAASSLSRAQSATELVIDCPALQPAEAYELGARARLLIGSSPTRPRPRSVQLHCTPREARLYIDDVRTARVDTRQGLIEGTLDALETLLLQSEPTPITQQRSASERIERPSQNHPARPTRDNIAPDGRRAPHAGRRTRARSPRRAQPWAIGGLGLGLTAEPWPVPLDVGVGPRLDVALGAGRVAAVASEALRIGRGPDTEAQVLDAQVGLAWGAPFAAGADWGALAMVGLQWLALPARDQTLRTSTLGLALRAAADTGPANLWLGLDGLARTSPQRSDRDTAIAMHPFSLVFSFGGFLLAK